MPALIGAVAATAPASLRRRPDAERPAPSGAPTAAALAGVVAYLVGREVPVFAAVPERPTLEDVYFEIQRRLDADPDWAMA